MPRVRSRLLPVGARTVLDVLPLGNTVARAISRAASKRIPTVKKVAASAVTNFLNRAPARRSGVRRNRGIRRPRARQFSTGGTNDSTHFSPIPVSFSAGMSSTGWRIGGTAQQLADFDANKSLRLAGFSRITSGNINVPVSTTGTTLFRVGGGNTNYIPLVPKNIDPRVDNIAKNFQFYAFRELRIRYVPIQTTAAPGTTYVPVINNAIAIGISDDYRATLGTTTTQTVSEFDPSMYTSVLAPTTMQYVHKGTRLWSMANPSEDDFDVQGQLVGVWENPPNSASAVSLEGTLSVGFLCCEYVLDLYGPSPLMTSDELSAPTHSAANRFGSPGAKCALLMSDVKDEKLAPPALTRQAVVCDDIKLTPLKPQPPVPVSPTASLLAKSLPVEVLRAARESWFDSRGKTKPDEKSTVK